MAKNLIFDLDGTLTDSSEGILKCALLALEHFGIEGYTEEDLMPVIGPPLRVSFPSYGVPEECLEEAVEVFRSRYLTVGKFENEPYEGIKDLLARLKADGHGLFIATSKPETTSLEILERFELISYFDKVCGASLEDGKRDSKEAVLRYLLGEIEGLSEDAIMVGDTKFDIIGAGAVGLPAVGVNWGFGDADEMLAHGAMAVVDTMEELYEVLKS